MKTRSLLPCLFAFVLLNCLSSCIKAEEDIMEEFCNNIKGLHAHPFTAVTEGQQIDISADYLDGANYYWSGPGNFQSYTRDNTVSTYASLSDRGWYYLKIYSSECAEDKFDSVYVDVKFPQGNPSCTLTNNTAAFSGALVLGDQSFSFVSFGSGPGGYTVTANSSNGDMTITMSDYWNTHDFEDGIYYTNSTLPDAINKILITDVNQSIFWTAEPNKPVYISHVGGKRRISFCGIQFSGTWGSTLYTTTVNTQLTQP
ncbi:MAG: hypothetical protein ABI741_01385 [Ferruginibacter sp.]